MLSADNDQHKQDLQRKISEPPLIKSNEATMENTQLQVELKRLVA